METNKIRKKMVLEIVRNILKSYLNKLLNNV